MKKVYFITGSQDLYGEECLRQVAEDSKVIASYLNDKIDGVEIQVKYLHARICYDTTLTKLKKGVI